MNLKTTILKQEESFTTQTSQIVLSCIPAVFSIGNDVISDTSGSVISILLKDG